MTNRWMRVVVQFLGKFDSSIGYLHNYDEKVTTDSEGRFTLSGLVAGMPGHVSLKRDGYRALFSQERFMPGMDEDVSFRLVPSKLPAEIAAVEVPSTDGMEPVEAVRFLIHEYETAEQTYRKKRNEAGNDSAVSDWIRMKYSPTKSWVAALRRLAESHADSEAELAQLVWCCRTAWQIGMSWMIRNGPF
ncbi:MAG: hypothetical protein R3C03_18155 [Pirellulaceae bacterium]